MAKKKGEAPGLVEMFFKARCTGTSLVAVQTADPAECVRKLLRGGALRRVSDGEVLALDPDAATAHLFRWDAATGLVGLTPAARAAVSDATGMADPSSVTEKLEGALAVARALPGDSVVFACNSHRLLTDDPHDLPAVQACWNLRDEFKKDFRTLALLGPQFSLPEELIHDVVVLRDPLPDDLELADIVARGVEDFKLPRPDAATIERGTLAVRGLPAEAAARAVAMSVTGAGLDVALLQERKKGAIEQVKGLSVLRGPERYADLVDLDGVVEFFQRLANGPDAPAVVVMLDEFEKSMAGSQTEGGDNTGVSQDRLMVILHTIEEYEWDGFLMYGVPGAGKTLTIKAFANESGALPLKLDLGQTSSSAVGASEARIRRVMDTLYAAGGRGRVAFAAAVNKTVTLPPELKRRFPVEWFYDLLSPTGRRKAWELMLDRYGIPRGGNLLPDDANWTGADIRNCCRLAARLRVPVADAARYIVPVAKADPASIEAARRHADGRLLDAATGREYVHPDKRGALARAERKVTL